MSVGTVVKPDPNEDFYVVWSNVAGSPLFYGSRKQLLSEMDDYYGPDPARFDRADQYGSSALWCYPPDMGFDEERRIAIFEQRGIIQVSQFKELCERLERKEDVSDLLEPLEE